MCNVNLFFIPHAGGSAMGYMNFSMFLDKQIRPLPLELAGRGKRISEKCFYDVRLCAEDLFEKNYALFKNGRYAFFGHSLGTIIAYELSKIIHENNFPEPEHMFVSGRPAPCEKVKSAFDNISELNDDDFIAQFSAASALPEQILNNKEILNMILPVLRADISMAERYSADYNLYKVPCDITVFYGKEDKLFSGKDTYTWKKCTDNNYSEYGFDGDHFYYSNPVNKKKLCEIINSILIKNI